jgi:hypothetical protein
MRNDGILAALACLKIVILETVNISASSFAVKARPIRSIRSANDSGSVELFLGLHGSIYLLSWICFRSNCRNIAYFYTFIPLYSYSNSPISSRSRQSVNYGPSLLLGACLTRLAGLTCLTGVA